VNTSTPGTGPSDRSFRVLTGRPDSPERLHFFHFQGLTRAQGLKHAFFTRHGGVSPPPYASLNASYSTGDKPEHVRENLSRIRAFMGGKPLLFMNQVHGKEILLLPKASSGFPEDVSADAAITDRGDLALMVKQADCQGVILYDPVSRVVSLVHCGWRGSTLNILGSVVESMVSDFHCRSDRILAAVGPSLGPCCAEFLTYPKIFPRSFLPFRVGENHFDLWEISHTQLMEAGVLDVNIEIARVCTSCRTDLFFSYRGEKTTGRFATVATLT
jgi:polyphenol oxidase